MNANASQSYRLEVEDAAEARRMAFKVPAGMQRTAWILTAKDSLGNALKLRQRRTRQLAWLALEASITAMAA